MIDIYFSPASFPAQLGVEVLNDAREITLNVYDVNGEVLLRSATHSIAALAALQSDAPLPEFVTSATERSVTLLLPYWGEVSDAVLYPKPMLNVPDGPVRLPV